MTEKLKSGSAPKPIVDAVNDLIDRIDALEAEQAADEAESAAEASKKIPARKTPAKSAGKADEDDKGE